MRPRLAQAAESGMQLVAIGGESTAERTLEDVQALLAQAMRGEDRPVRLTFTTYRTSAAWGGASCLQRGPSPSDPRPLSAEAWEAMLAAGRRETAARAHALALQQTDTPRETMQWVWFGIGADEVAKRRVGLGLQGCYRERYGDARPAADREHDWDGM